jgi:hypothetical protein
MDVLKQYDDKVYDKGEIRPEDMTGSLLGDAADVILHMIA